MPLAGKLRPALEPVWSIEFSRGPQEVARLGGTVYGSPVWTPDGVELDGAADSIAFPGSGIFTRPEITIRVDFEPGFDWDDGNHHLFFDTEASNRSYISKTNTNALNVVVNGGAASMTGWSAYWKAGARNVLVAAASSGSIQTYLNNALIDTDVSTFSPTQHNELLVGIDYTGSNRFAGALRSIAFFDGKWTADEVTDDYNGTTFRYRERATLWLDMKSATEDTEKDGTEQLTDGDMEAAGTASYTAGRSTLSKVAGSPGGTGSQVLRVTANGTGEPYVTNGVALSGQQYRARGRYRTDGVDITQVRMGVLGVTAVTLESGIADSNWRYFDIVFTAGGAGSFYFLGNNGASAGQWLEFDDLSVVPTGQLIDDGAMEMDGTGEWTAGNSAVLSKVSGALRVAYNGSPNPYARQAVMVVGRKYRATGKARGDGTAYPLIAEGAAPVWTGTTSTDWQDFDVTFTAATSTHFRLYSLLGVAGYCEFDNLDVREVYAVTPDLKGNLVKLGDGRGSGEPVFVNPGFRMDDAGGNYFGATGDLSAFGSDEFTMVALVRPNDGVTSAVDRVLVFSDDSEIRWTVEDNGNMRVYCEGKLIINAAVPDVAFKGSGMAVLVAAMKSGDSDGWANGFNVVTADSTTWVPAVPAKLHIGNNAGLGLSFKGSYFNFGVFPYKLTPTQVRDLTSYLLHEYGGVS